MGEEPWGWAGPTRGLSPGVGQWLLDSVMGEGRMGGCPSLDWDADRIPTQEPERDASLTSKYLTGNTLRNKDPALHHRFIPSSQMED